MKLNKILMGMIALLGTAGLAQAQTSVMHRRDLGIEIARIIDYAGKGT